MAKNPISYTRQLEKNIIKYTWFKVFTKRVYLPLIAVHLVNVGKVTVEEIALIAIISAAVSISLQMPTGYIADKLGNRFAIIVGAAIMSVSPLFYAFMPNFTGGLLASLLFFGGYAFQSGAIEAFMHDTLKALGRDKEYSKIMGRAQSYGLIGNVVLLALVPATYVIDTSLPFILGFISLVIMLWLAVSFTVPHDGNDKQAKNPFKAVATIVSWQNAALFLFAGFVTGVAHRGGEYRELVYQDIGVAISLFGLLVALGSLVGAILGRFIHVLDRLRPLQFYLFDLVFMASCFLAIGLSSNQIIVVASFTLFAGYDRVRMIIFQSKLLNEVQHAYKATLLSALNLFTIVGGIGAVALLAKAIGVNGYLFGYWLFGVAVLGIGLLLWSLMLVEHRHRT